MGYFMQQGIIYLISIIVLNKGFGELDLLSMVVTSTQGSFGFDPFESPFVTKVFIDEYNG